MDSEYRSGAVTDLELSRAYSGKLNRAQSYKHLVLGVAEAGVIFICACLPICRQVFGNIRSAIVPSFLSSRKALSKINESDHKGLESSDSLEKQSTRRISRPHVWPKINFAISWCLDQYGSSKHLSLGKHNSKLVESPKFIKIRLALTIKDMT